MLRPALERLFERLVYAGSLPRVKLAHREEGPADGPVALLLHGYPESSYMWSHTMDALAGAGWRAIAPDLLGFGDSDSDPPHTWERHVESIEEFRSELGLERVALVMHDWGGLIGLWWACEHPEAVSALVISASGFFPDGKWHGVAQAARTPGTGEEMVEGMTREGFEALLKQNGSGFTERVAERVLEVLRRPDPPARPPGLLALGRLREARALRRQARGAGRAHLPALGRDGPVRLRVERAPLPAGDPRCRSS